VVRLTSTANAKAFLLPSLPGLTEPVGTGSETMGTGRTGSDQFRFRSVPTGPNLKIDFELKMKKKSHIILKNTSRCVEFNGVKIFQIFVRLV
jgi:hypothetical protein